MTILEAETETEESMQRQRKRRIAKDRAILQAAYDDLDNCDDLFPETCIGDVDPKTFFLDDERWACYTVTVKFAE